MPIENHYDFPLWNLLFDHYEDGGLAVVSSGHCACYDLELAISARQSGHVEGLSMNDGAFILPVTNMCCLAGRL